MNWFKRWWGKGARQRTSLEDITSSIEALSEAVSSNESGIQKGLRRLSMAQKQQSDTLAMLAQESASLKFTLTECQGLTLTYDQVLHTLDNLSKIDHAVSNVTDSRNVITPLIERTAKDLLSLCALETMVEIGKPYPDKACEVVGAVETLEQPQWPPGTVVEVLQQGYQTAQGDVVRAAKVVVSREPTPTSVQIITQFKGTDHVN